MADTDNTERRPAAIDRRRALARLGLAATVAYVAPTLVHLDRSANAQVSLSPCGPPGKGGAKGICRDRD